MMYNLLLVGIGGAAGSMLRYLCQRQFNNSFPFGTLLVNLAGCFIIGLTMGLFAKGGDVSRRLLIATGFCGGFTTFSAFTQEGIRMMMDNRWLTFALYLSASIVLGLAATYSGFKLTNS